LLKGSEALCETRTFCRQKHAPSTLAVSTDSATSPPSAVYSNCRLVNVPCEIHIGAGRAVRVCKSERTSASVSSPSAHEPTLVKHTDIARVSLTFIVITDSST